MARRKDGTPKATFANMQEANDGRIIVIAVQRHIDISNGTEDSDGDSSS